MPISKRVVLAHLAKMSRMLVIVSLIAAFGVAPAPTQAATNIVVPNSKAAVEGNSDNGFPLNLAHFGLTSQRYQQVYGASQFAAVSGPQLITQIVFRPDATFGAAF